MYKNMYVNSQVRLRKDSDPITTNTSVSKISPNPTKLHFMTKQTTILYSDPHLGIHSYMT